MAPQRLFPRSLLADLERVRRSDAGADAEWVESQTSSWRFTPAGEFEQSTLRKLVLASDSGLLHDDIAVRDRQALERPPHDNFTGLMSSLLLFRK